MNRTIFLLAGLLALVPLLLYLLANTGPEQRRTLSTATDNDESDNPSITVFCAASNQAVMEAIVRDYRRQFGREVFVNYGPSQGLLSQVEVSRMGDLFLPADDSYLTTAREKKLVSETFPIASMRAVVLVQRGNPKQILQFADLLRPDVRFVQANPEAAAIGKITQAAFTHFGIWEAADKATTAYRGNVTEAAADVAIGSADAAIIYDCVLHNYPDLDSVELPELESAVSEFGIGLIVHSQHPVAARQFVDFVISPDHGMARYREYGFNVPESKVSPTP